MLKAGMPPLCLPRRLPHRLLHWAWCVMGVMSLLSSRWFYPGGVCNCDSFVQFPPLNTGGLPFLLTETIRHFCCPSTKVFPLGIYLCNYLFPPVGELVPPHIVTMIIAMKMICILSHTKDTPNSMFHAQKSFYAIFITISYHTFQTVLFLRSAFVLQKTRAF